MNINVLYPNFNISFITHTLCFHIHMLIQKAEDGEEMVTEEQQDTDSAREGGEKRVDGEGEGEGEDEHAYLLLSRADSTMVLQTGQEIAELDSSGFATQAPTIFAGNLGSGHYIVQVSQAFLCTINVYCCNFYEKVYT